MSSLETLARDYAQLSELIADAILRRTSPVSDEISESEAQKAYGTRWLNRMRDGGLAEYSRCGNKKLYSRHQLDCLKAAERESARLVMRMPGTAGADLKKERRS